MPPPDALPLVTQEILTHCPKFRVLVVGRSGVGKSSLINHVFGIDMNSVSHQKPGECDINDEITSSQNPLFALHDSMGFEPGQITNFIKAKDFLMSRSGSAVALKDRVHAIWLCIHVPVAGKRVFETGDEEFLKLASSMEVPIIVVFTQFDKLVNRMEQVLTDEEEAMDDDQINQLCLRKAEDELQKACVDPLKRIISKPTYARSSGLAGQQDSEPDRQALAHLVQITRDLVQRHVEGEVWIVSAMAQRASARVKINASIEVGMKGYWTVWKVSRSLDRIFVFDSSTPTRPLTPYTRISLPHGISPYRVSISLPRVYDILGTYLPTTCFTRTPRIPDDDPYILSTKGQTCSSTTGLASSAKFLDKKLEECLHIVHQEITDSWNFYDPHEVGLRPFGSPNFRMQLVMPDTAEAKSWFENLDQIQTLVGFGTTIVAAAAVGPTIAAMGLSVVFVKWIANAYSRTPETLRCFMGYIIDLTLIMDQLFLLVLAIRPPRALTRADIDLALENYKNSEIAKVHREIRQYANKASFAQILRSNNAEEKVKELIEKYCPRYGSEQDDVQTPPASAMSEPASRSGRKRFEKLTHLGRKLGLMKKS
ncbi:hypothetical protein B0H11DRAFT_2375583 [Mycena galericulata]|nr:hypothetical protein B0H11DRAFT_2375583 [Mycena galericulata]